MGAKSTQLQIRISPAQKAALKRLATAEGLSVSEFVLRRALPAESSPLATWVEAIARGAAIAKSLSDLRLRIDALDDDAFRESTTHFDPTELSELQANGVAAVVERECAARGLPVPEWTKAVPAMSAPWFAWRLRSLRPHLMRITPVSFKRRGIYLPDEEDRRR